MLRLRHLRRVRGASAHALCGSRAVADVGGDAAAGSGTQERNAVAGDHRRSGGGRLVLLQAHATECDAAGNSSGTTAGNSAATQHRRNSRRATAGRRASTAAGGATAWRRTGTTASTAARRRSGTTSGKQSCATTRWCSGRRREQRRAGATAGILRPMGAAERKRRGRERTVDESLKCGDPVGDTDVCAIRLERNRHLSNDDGAERAHCSRGNVIVPSISDGGDPAGHGEGAVRHCGRDTGAVSESRRRS